MSKAKIKKTIDQLVTVAGEIGNLNGLPLSHESRCKVREAVDLATKIGFTRQDRDHKIYLYWGNNQLSEVVEIGATNDQKEIWANADRLWGTICGYNEQIQEMEAYESK